MIINASGLLLVIVRYGQESKEAQGQRGSGGGSGLALAEGCGRRGPHAASVVGCILDLG